MIGYCGNPEPGLKIGPLPANGPVKQGSLLAVPLDRHRISDRDAHQIFSGFETATGYRPSTRNDLRHRNISDVIPTTPSCMSLAVIATCCGERSGLNSRRF